MMCCHRDRRFAGMYSLSGDVHTMALLRIRKGGKIKDEGIVGRRVTVGRDTECDIVINSTDVSRLHCQVELINGKYHVIDLNSRHGIRVNGFSADNEVLNNGDVISIGNVHMTFLDKEPEIHEAVDEEEPQQDTKAKEQKAADEPRKWFFTVIADGIETRHELKKKKTVIGRGNRCDIRIQVNSISSKHAEIICDKDKVALRDLKSTNGTYVNKQRVEEAVLKGGESIQLGNVVCTFSLG